MSRQPTRLELMEQIDELEAFLMESEEELDQERDARRTADARLVLAMQVIQSLRVSLARCAQEVYVQTPGLPVLGKTADELHAMALTHHLGWGKLGARLVDHLAAVQGIADQAMDPAE